MATTLNIAASVEIDNLLDVVRERLNISWDEAESRAMDEGIYPESSKTYITSKFGGYEEGTLAAEAVKALQELGFEAAYITHAI